MAYGLISRFLPLAGTSRPTIVAASETAHIPVLPRNAGTSVRNDVSFFHRTSRLT